MKCFREAILEVTVNTSNGVERKNKDFMNFYRNVEINTLSGIVAVLVKQFLPEIYSRYLILATSEMYFFSNYDKKWVCMTLFFNSQEKPQKLFRSI